MYDYDHFVDIPLDITVKELLNLLYTKNVPIDALIRYTGCGSHSIEVIWND